MKLKYLFLLLCIAICIQINAQSIVVIEKDLTASFSKINTDHYDSLEAANNHFQRSLLNYTSAIPYTIRYNFKNLRDSGLNIQTSKDGIFRIYSWDDMSGGTMRFFRNVFQYKAGDRVYSKTYDVPASEEEIPEMGHNYVEVDQVTAQGKTYYVTQSYAKGSSAMYFFTVKIFSIDGDRLNDTAKLIMTKTGLHNELSYEVDWSAGVNRDNDLPRENSGIKYNAEKRTISIPLIKEDGKITAKRIVYQFNGQYFVKQ